MPDTDVPEVDIASRPAEDMMGDIYVGTGAEEKLWRVHIKRFGDVSPWLKREFAAAISARPDDASPTVKLPAESARIFGWVHNYTYAVSFSGLRAAPVPEINDAGSHGLQAEQPAEEIPADSDSDDDVVITSVRVKVENESKPLMNPAPEEVPAPATNDAKSPGPNQDEIREVTVDRITQRDLMDLYLLCLKLEIFSLRNAAIDALHVWFHPDVQDKEKPRRRNRGRTVNPASSSVVIDDDEAANTGGGSAGYESAKQLPFRRVPWLTDVQHVFARTPEDNPLRRFLISTVAIFLFSKRPQGKDLPEEWKAVLTQSGEIGYCLLQFIAKTRWVAGSKTTSNGKLEILRIWAKHAFHEAETNISLN
jgi:hypothetical protein